MVLGQRAVDWEKAKIMARNKEFKKFLPTLIFYFNIVLQIGLFVIFLNFFGIPAITKYLKKETMIVYSEEETNGIEAPAITMLAEKDTDNGFSLGWNTVGERVTNMVAFEMFDLCMNAGFTDVKTCVSNDTFELRQFLKEARLGLYGGKLATSLFGDPSISPLWTEDMTVSFSGRYFTLSISRTIMRSEPEIILFRVDSSSSFSYTFFLHDENFFLMNINPFSLPSKRWQFKGNILNVSGYSHDLTLTRHKRLNLEQRPCEKDPAYSFTVCVKEKLSARFGCRLPWDKWSRYTGPMTTVHEAQRRRNQPPPEPNTARQLVKALQRVQSSCNLTL